jgi:glycosyltransferase involved in cell wall biosynthesis
MLDSPEILIFTDWFSPGYKAGGPIRSIENIAALLGGRAFIVTSDRDLGDEEAYPGVLVNQWINGKHGAQVIYISSDDRGDQKLKEIMSQYQDSPWYLNSMFSKRFTILPLRFRKKMKFENKVVLAPRGMLHPNAMRIKRWKKLLFIKALKRLGWVKGVVWQATSEEEMEYIHHFFGKDERVVFCANIPTFHAFREAPQWKPSQQLWVMLTRLSEEKGVLEGLEWWSRHPMSRQIKMLVVGPHENEDYSKRVEQWVAQHPECDVQLLGSLQVDAYYPLLQKAHFLFSPTRGENYGHAIAESLFMGLPVIVADTTPWRDLMDRKLGIDFNRSEKGLHRAMDLIFNFSEEDYRAMILSLKKFRILEEAALIRNESWGELFEKH